MHGGPLIKAGRKGVYLRCVDKQISKCYPIVASYIADFPEQARIACTKQSGCTCCIVEPDHRQDNVPESQIQYCDAERELGALQQDYYFLDSLVIMDIDGLRSIYPPVWKRLPHLNIFWSFTPDLLHQLHKGVFSLHIFVLAVKVTGEEELEKRLKCIPAHPSLRGSSA